MHDIARHSLVSLVAFGLSRLLSLVIVGLVVGEYGLAAFGLIMLVRAFLPTQLLALFSFGLPEAVTRAIAHDLAAEEPARALGLYLAALLAAGAIGLVLALPLVLAAAPLGAFVFDLDATDSAFLVPAIVAQGAALPLLFAGTLAESALRGQEAFGVLRSTEVLTNLAYGLVALLLIQLDAGAVGIALAYLGGQVLKAIAALLLARRGFPQAARQQARPAFRLLLQEGAYLRAQFARRIGSVVASQLPRLAIAHVLGAAAVGLFEALLRIPIFLRSLVAVANSVVLPVVVRLGTAGREVELAQLAVQGPRLLLAMASLIALPPVCLAQPLLVLWLGAEVAAYWPWFALLSALAPLHAATVGFWSAMGNAELTILRRQNHIGRLQALIVLTVALPLLGSLGAAAFWLGLLCGLLFSLPALLLLAARRHSLPAERLAASLALVLAVSLPAAALGVLLQHWIALDDWPRLLTAFALVSALQAFMLALFVLRPEERRTLLRLGRG